MASDTTDGWDDDRLAAALAQELGQGLDEAQVDVASLLVGARQGARRVRRRRRATTAVAAAFALAVAVPVGAGVLLDDDAPSRGPVAGGPGPASSGAPTAARVSPEPTSPEPTSPSPPSFPTAENGSVDIPRDAMLSGQDVPFGGDLTDVGSRRGVLTLGTLICPGESEPAAESDLGGRSRYVSGQVGQGGVTTSVRVFAGDGAARVQTYLADALGRCNSVSSTWQLLPTDGVAGDQPVLALTADTPEPGMHNAVGSVREGGTVVSVNVQLRGTVDETVSLTRDLLAAAHEKLLASGLPAAYPG